MKILLTGAFGNLGASTLENLLRHHKHDIRCFDMRSPRNEKEMKRLLALGEFETCWGDITDPESVNRAVEDRECVLHLAAIIPPFTERSPELAERVNVGGTRNIIEAARSQPKPPKLVFTSSVTVHGNRHSVPPPRRAHEPTQPSDVYTRTKIASENEIRESGLDWTILRVGAAMPVKILQSESFGFGSLEYAFGIPLDQRIEVIHPADVATAIANAPEADTAGKILYLGGGKNCQLTNRILQTRLFQALGIGMVCDRAFRKPKDDSEYWCTDFMDTEESQRLLKFQNHTFEHYLEDLKRAFGWRRWFTVMLGPVIRRWVLKASPYYQTSS